MKSSGRLAIVFLALVAASAALAPVLAGYSYHEQNLADRLLSPNAAHWMGTDALGRDVLSRVLHGARVSLGIGLVTAVFALVLGLTTGLIAGYAGGWVDRALMQLVDVFYIFPSLLTAILVTLLVGRGFVGICLAIGLSSWVSLARLVRAQTLQAREMPYVESAKALGARPPAIVFKHILPNLWGPILVSMTFQVPANILNESFLSFLGLGLQPPFASWGTLASEGFRAIRSYPHLMIGPGVVLFATLLAFQVLGDSLKRD